MSTQSNKAIKSERKMAPETQIPLEKTALKSEGKSCHQCKSIQPIEDLISCQKMSHNIAIESEAINKNCKKKYCKRCLNKFYPKRTFLVNNAWVCPSCQLKCCCANCRQRRLGITKPRCKKRTNDLLFYKKRKFICEKCDTILPDEYLFCDHILSHRLVNRKEDAVEALIGRIRSQPTCISELQHYKEFLENDCKAKIPKSRRKRFRLSAMPQFEFPKKKTPLQKKNNGNIVTEQNISKEPRKSSHLVQILERNSESQGEIEKVKTKKSSEEPEKNFVLKMVTSNFNRETIQFVRFKFKKDEKTPNQFLEKHMRITEQKIFPFGPIWDESWEGMYDFYPKVTIMELGTKKFGKRLCYENFDFSANYCSQLMWPSTINPDSFICYTNRIKYDAAGNVNFEVESSFPREMFFGTSSRDVWEKVFKKIDRSHKKSFFDEESNDILDSNFNYRIFSGEDLFGLSHPVVRKLIRLLPRREKKEI